MIVALDPQSRLLLQSRPDIYHFSVQFAVVFHSTAQRKSDMIMSHPQNNRGSERTHSTDHSISLSFHNRRLKYRKTSLNIKRVEIRLEPLPSLSMKKIDYLIREISNPSGLPIGCISHLHFLIARFNDSCSNIR